MAGPLRDFDVGIAGARFFFGFQDDPFFDEWQQAIADRRREMDADPDVP